MKKYYMYILHSVIALLFLSFFIFFLGFKVILILIFIVIIFLAFMLMDYLKSIPKKTDLSKNFKDKNNESNKSANNDKKELAGNDNKTSFSITSLSAVKLLLTPFKSFILISKIVVICIILVIAYISYLKIFNKNVFTDVLNLKEVVRVNATLAGTKNIEKLYTATSVVILDDLKTKGEEEYLIGICSRRYEVDIGYENIGKILNNEQLMQKVCEGDYQALPNPLILSVNNVHQEIIGHFTVDDDCYKIEQDSSHRMSLMYKQLLKHNVLNRDESKKKLQTFLSVDCKESNNDNH